MAGAAVCSGAGFRVFLLVEGEVEIQVRWRGFVRFGGVISRVWAFRGVFSLPPFAVLSLSLTLSLSFVCFCWVLFFPFFVFTVRYFCVFLILFFFSPCLHSCLSFFYLPFRLFRPFSGFSLRAFPFSLFVSGSAFPWRRSSPSTVSSALSGVSFSLSSPSLSPFCYFSCFSFFAVSLYVFLSATYLAFSLSVFLYLSPLFPLCYLSSFSFSLCATTSPSHLPPLIPLPALPIPSISPSQLPPPPRITSLPISPSPPNLCSSICR